MIYNKNDIARLRVAAVHFDLDAPTEFWNLPAAELLKICNGVGPASWLGWLRTKLTQLAGEYEVVAAIHDVQQEFKLGSNKSASHTFLQNALKIWHRRHGFKGFVILCAVFELAVAVAAFLALYFWGDKYWEDAKNDDPK